MQPAAGRPQRQKLPAAAEEQQGDSPASCNGSGTDTSDSGGNISDGSAGGLAEAQPASPHDDDDGMGAPDIAEQAESPSFTLTLLISISDMHAC